MFLLCLFEQLFHRFLFLILSFGPDCLFGRAYGFQLLGMTLLQCPPVQLLAQVCKQSVTIIVTGRNEVVAKVIFLHLSVIHSVHRGGGGLPQCMLGYHPPRSRHPPGPDTPPPGADPTGKQTPAYGLRAAGTHPTGMHSCFNCRSVTVTHCSLIKASFSQGHNPTLCQGESHSQCSLIKSSVFSTTCEQTTESNNDGCKVSSLHKTSYIVFFLCLIFRR